MECTPRVNPSDYQAQQYASGGVAGVYTQRLTGTVMFDLNDPADVALIQSGGTKTMDFYSSLVVTSSTIAVSTPVDLPYLTAFTLSFQLSGEESGNLAYMYDECAEIELVNEDSDEVLARAWLWQVIEGDPDLNLVCPGMTPGQVVLSYEGPAIKPAFRVRTGIIPAQSDPTLAYRIRCSLLPLATAANGQARITIPTPCCVPPFMPFGAKKGTYLFSESADPAITLPGPQPLPFPRLFRTLAINGAFPVNGSPAFDAKLFGGPWRAQAYAVTFAGGDTVMLAQDQMCQNQPEPYNMLQLDTQTGAAISLSKAALVEACRIGGTSTATASIEILAVYP